MGLGTETLGRQVQALLDGKPVIPSIQRGYVRLRNQMPHLLDSVYRGCPAGTKLPDTDDEIDAEGDI